MGKGESVTNRDPIEINGRIWTYDETSRSHKPRDTKAASDRPAGQTADVELPASSESVGAGKGAAFDSRVGITIVSYRTRLADADGVSGKAVIDGLVNCGVLANDTTKEIAEVRYRQIKVKNQADEKTEIIIEEI